MTDLTRLLEEFHANEVAAEELFDVIYRELRVIARSKLKSEKAHRSLAPTALVHEAYIRLFGGASTNWENRRHFFGAAAEVMRRVLIDEARRRNSAKRGGALVRHTLEGLCIPITQQVDDIIHIDEALSKLALTEPNVAELVRLRYFVGLTIAEAAETIGVSVRTANRDWNFARAFLHRELRDAR